MGVFGKKSLNPGDPSQNGGPGDDAFTAPDGSSGINGFGGIDTAVFNFRLVDANISYSGATVIIDTATSHTELTGIQTYVFTDGTVNEHDDNPLVDDLYYYSRYHDVWTAHGDAEADFAQFGWQQGRNPSAFFNTRLYLVANSDVAAAGVDPLEHFRTFGWKEGRLPSINFDSFQYLQNNPDVAASGVNPLEHFLAFGRDEGRASYMSNFSVIGPSGFDHAFYLLHNPDVAAAGVDPLVHFLTIGWKEGRNPGSWFDTRGYLATYTDVAAAGVNPFVHFLQFGWKEGRDPSPAFDTTAYLLANPDVAAAGVNPLVHYLHYGVHEGRTAFALSLSNTSSPAVLPEGAAAGTTTGIDLSWGGWASPTLIFSITGDTSGGGFTIDASTGVVTVADSTRLDFESSGGTYTIVVQARDGEHTQSETFTIGIADVIPTTPVDANAAANNVVEGAANGSAVGVTLFSDEPNGPPVTYELTNNAGGRFAVDPSTGVVTVAGGFLDFESSGPAHTFTITGRATIGAVVTATQNFTITVLDAPPSVPVDNNGAANFATEGAPNGTLVGLTVFSTDPNGPFPTYSLTDSAGGRFQIDSLVGIVTIGPNVNLVDFESSGGSYSITARATVGGLSSSQTFIINVGDVAPNQPTDGNGGTNTVAEGATTGAVVGVTVASTDINGGALTYNFATGGDAGGRFQINTSTGVISVSAAGAGSIDYETSGPTHSYDITVVASDGTLTSVAQTFTIAVTNVAPDAPADADTLVANSVQEGTGAGVYIGLTAQSPDPNSAAAQVTYTLLNTLGDRFAINTTTGAVSTGVNANLIDFETSPTYQITVIANDNSGALNATASTLFTITVQNAAPAFGAPGTGLVFEDVGDDQSTGLTVAATDPAGTAVTYSLTDSAGGRFQIDPVTGVVTTDNSSLIDFETSAGSYNITVRAEDTAGAGTEQIFTVNVADRPPTSWVDGSAAPDVVTEGATSGTIGIIAQAFDPKGGTVHYSLVGAQSNAQFDIDEFTGVITVDAAAAIDFESTGGSYNITVRGADDSGAFTDQIFVVAVQNTAPEPITDTDPDPLLGLDGEILEGELAGTLVQITAHSTDPADPGPTVIKYELTNNAGGLFQIDPDTGVVTLTTFGENNLSYESSGASHSFAITVKASDGTSPASLFSTQTFTIAVLNAAPADPEDTDGPVVKSDNDQVQKTAVAGAAVGIDLASTDPNGGTVSFSLTDDTGALADAGGLFTVDAAGVVRVANPAQLATAGAGDTFVIQARAFDGTAFSAAVQYTVTVIDNVLTLDLNGAGGNGAGVDFTTTFTEGPTAVGVADTDDTITNPGNPGANTIVSATIVLTDAQAGDSLAIDPLGLPGGISSVITPGAGTITVTLSGSASFADYATALQRVEFSTSGDAPNTSDRHVQVTITDGTSNSSADTTIHVESVNDAPTLNLTPPAPLPSYTENDAPVALEASGMVTDPDSPANFNTGSYSVEITNPFAGDEIVITGAGFALIGVSLLHNGTEIGTVSGLGPYSGVGSYVVAVSLNSAATPAVVNSLSSAFSYRSTSENPGTTQRDVTFTFNDGNNTHTDAGSTAQDSNVVHQTVDVTALNDAPVIGNLAGDIASFTEGAVSAVLLDAATAATVTDVDSANFDTGTLTVSITANEVAAEDVLGIQNQGIGAGQIGVSGTDVTFENTVIGTFTGGTAGADLVITFDPDATPAAVQALVRALTYDNTNDTTASTATRAISVTLTDGDGGSTSVNTTVAVAEASNLTGQLWYVTRDGTTAGDNVVGHINSDGGGVVHFSLGADTMNDVGLDTSADLYFLLESNQELTSYRLSGTTVLDTETVGAAADPVDAIVVDPLHNTIFVTVTGATAATTGIQTYTYDPATGALTAGTFLLTSASLTTGAYVQGIDLSIDLLSERLYYVDSDAATSNGIYLVDYTDGSNVATNLTTAESLVQFALDGSEGFIEAVAVDNRDTAATTDDIIYFLTNDTLATPTPGTASLWYLDRSGSNTTPALLGSAPALAGVSTHTGLVFDPVANQLYISNQDNAGNTDSIIQVQLDAAGTTATGSVAFDLTTLTGQATPDNSTIPGQTAFDVLPSLTVAASAIFTEVNPVSTPVTLDNLLTLFDPEGYLNGATISTAGGFLGDGDALDANVAGTSIGKVVNSVGGNVTLTLSGYDTVAHYQQVLQSITFTSGDNPSNFGGTNPSRTVTWYVDDGAAGDPHSTGNTKTTTITIAAANDAPALDLDSTDLAPFDYTAAYGIGGAPAAVASANVSIVDADDTNIETATVDLTTGHASDLLAIAGALPAGISATIDTATVDHIIVHLSGSAPKSAYQAALHQVVFTTDDPSLTPAARTVTVLVNDGDVASNTATTTINVTANPPPQAADDTDLAIEAGGINNGAAGQNPIGNVITGTGTDANAAGADNDPNGPQSGISVIAVAKGTETTPGTPGTVGAPLTGDFGVLTLNSDGSYSYQLNNANAAVQALRTSGQQLFDTFTYTVQDTTGASETDPDGGAETNSVATLTITINGANDDPVAVADPVSATEAGTGAGVDPSGNVLTNDTDVDSVANGETRNVSGAAVGIVGGPIIGGTGVGLHNANPALDYGTFTVQAGGSFIYAVNNANTAVQALRAFTDTVADTFSYTVQDAAGATSTTQATVTIHGQNDSPVAGDDIATATEAGGTNNGTAGTNPSGDVLANDNDVDAFGETETVQGVAGGNQGSTVLTTGVGGLGVAGNFGTLTLNANGSFNYVVNQSNLTIQQLNVGQSQTDTFTYTMRDAIGVTDNALVTITINGANDAPVAVADGTALAPFAIVLENRTTNVTAVNLLTNDTDIDTAAVNFTAIKDTNTVNGGTVTVSTTGTFSVTYAPGSNYLGTDTFTYHVNDNGTPNLSSSSATVTIEVQPLVWFIDDSLAVSDATHFKTIAEFNTANAAASATTRPDIVYLRFGDDGVYSTTDGVNLKDGQALLGQGVDLTYNKTLGGVGLIEDHNGETPVIVVTGGTGNAGVTLAQNNFLTGFNIAMNNADSIGIEDGGGTVGTLKLSGVSIGVDPDGVGGISGALGKAIDIDQGGTLAGTAGDTATFGSITSIGSNSEGIQLTGVGGTTLGGKLAVTGATSITNADTNGIQIGTTAAGASFNFGTSTTVTDNAVGGHDGNGINLLSGIGTTNSFTFGTLSVTTEGGFGLAANGGTVNISGTSSTINATGGAAVDLTNTSLGSGATFATVSSANNSTGNGIQITGLSTGNFTANGGAITNATGTDVLITGGTANITYNGTITDDVGTLVSVSGKTGGTVDFNGAITDGNDGDGSGISLTSNTGATVRFDGGLTLSTGANAAFTATGGGTVAVTNQNGGVNTIVTTSGTALNVANTNIHADDLTFRSISAGTAAGSAGVGISLDTTGSAGGLHVTGTGTAGSGGTIQHKTGADGSTTGGIGIYLNNTSDVQFDRMQLNDFDNFAIRGNNVTDFKFDNSVISGSNGNAAGAFDEAAISFNNLLGTASISNGNITNGFEYILKVLNSSGTLTRLTIDNTDFGTNNTALGGDAFQIVASNTATANVTVINSGFTNAREDLFNAVATQTANMDVVFRDNTLSNNHTNKVSAASNILVFSTSTGTVTYDISHNTLTTGATGSAIAAAKGVPDAGSGGTMTGTINANTIGTGAVGSGSQFVGIFASALGSGTHTTAITNNTIRNYNEEGIFLKANDNLTGGNSVLNATVTGNITTNPDPLAFAGLWVLAGSGSGTETNTVNVVLGNFSAAAVAGSPTGSLQNDFTNGDPANATDVFLQEAGSGSVINLSRAGSASGTAAGVVQDDNVGTPTVVASGTVNLVNTLPPTPPPVAPLMAADGQGPGGVGSLTSHELAPIVAEAIHRWAEAGVPAGPLSTLAGVEITIGDLAAGMLASTAGSHIAIDADAAGWGWFVDATPAENSEFATVHSPTELAAAGGDAAGHIDLLSAIMHEIGHVLGLDHTDVPGRLMDEAVDVGIRRLASAQDVAAAAANTSQPPEALRAPEIVGQNIVGGFDAEYYLAHNPDVAAAGVDPHAHFDNFGWHEGRNPNAFFDAAGYLAHYADVAAAGVNPLQHYAEFGWREGRDPSAAFDTLAYLAANPDVAAAHVNPLEHFLQFGLHEGRAAVNDGMWR